MANAHKYLATRVVAVGAIVFGMAGFDVGMSLAASVACSVDPVMAYSKAHTNGARFVCQVNKNNNVQASFVGQIRGAIACVYNTPETWEKFGRPKNVSIARMFLRSPAFNGSWRLKAFKIKSDGAKIAPVTTDKGIAFRATTPKPNATYTVRLTQMVLEKEQGDCDKAIDEAF